MTHNILHKSEFLSRCRIEKRRADRSKLPLSIALLSFREEAVGDHPLTQEFLKSLQKNTRETDIKGWVDHNVIGLLLPDTSVKGVQQFVNKIVNGNGDVTYSVITGTYPDDLFQKLLAEEGQPDLFPIDLDKSYKT